MIKYQTKETVPLLKPDLLAKFDPIGSDTINETEIFDAIKKTKQSHSLCLAAVQMAIIGIGGKSSGEFRDSKGKVRDLLKFLEECGVNCTLNQNMKLRPGELTPRRLIRVFRFHTQHVLQERKDIQSYLNTKWSKGDSESRTLIFPGCEHMCQSQDHANMILECYAEQDERLANAGKQSGILGRIKRILIAQGYKTEV